tara:strand:- start:373 stop:576 length:204 start_codon:yes stop_codon:yes gene_type:complete
MKSSSSATGVINVIQNRIISNCCPEFFFIVSPVEADIYVEIANGDRTALAKKEGAGEAFRLRPPTVG